MNEKRIVLDMAAPESWKPHLSRAAERLRGGGLVAFPTDTVYGLAADPSHEAALHRVFELKSRQKEKPIPWLISGPEQAVRMSLHLSPDALRLMERYWPGPLTLVLSVEHYSAQPSVEKVLTQGVRMPDHPVALALLEAANGALAVTSANRSGEPDLLTGEAVEAELGDHLDLILDGGRSPGDMPSTVLDMHQKPPRVLRKGPISREELSEFLGTKVE